MRRTSRIWAAGAAMAAVSGLVGCSSSPWSDSNDGRSHSDAMVVEVSVTSDAATIERLRVEIDAREDPHVVDQDVIDAPYTETFEVPLAVPFPLSGTQVEATAGPGGTYVACQIRIDGKVVDENRADGEGANVVCSQRLRVGPQ